MQELIANLNNTAVLYVEDRQNNKNTDRIKEGLKEIIKTLDLKLKYNTEEEVIEKALEKLENIYKATKTKDIFLIQQALQSLYNTFTLACGVLTTLEQK